MRQAADLRDLLTPAMRDGLQRMARAGLPPIHTSSPQQARTAYEAGAGVLEIAAPPLARVEDFSISARARALRHAFHTETHL